MELPQHLTVETAVSLLNSTISLSKQDLKRVTNNYLFLQNKIASGSTFYGVNTGFGSLCNVRIADDQIRDLQRNLVCSHACGMGDECPEIIVRLMLLLKIKNLSKGYSGIHEDTIQRLVYFYNNRISPIVYEQGSLGASGDLAPLAHLSLPLLGEGEVRYKQRRLPSKELIEQLGLKSLELHAKEGLALLNGTQFMSAYAVWAVHKAQQLSHWADVIAALSLEAFDGKAEPFSIPLHTIRPHQGQLATAQAIRQFLEGSELQQQIKTQVQDPYSIRCVPQVHGASKDAIEHVKRVVEIEINAVTDNPTVFEEENAILSGGNFHGQPLAIHLDFLAIALAELANISERRTYLLISGQRNLPPFLAKDAGLNSGMMIAQYTAASIVSQNKQLCTPASIDSIVSSNGQEDHVSMGANAATKLFRIVENVQRVLGIELLNATQAISFRRPLTTSIMLENLIRNFRQKVAVMETDRVLHYDMQKATEFLDKDAAFYF